MLLSKNNWSLVQLRGLRKLWQEKLEKFTTYHTIQWYIRTSKQLNWELFMMPLPKRKEAHHCMIVFNQVLLCQKLSQTAWSGSNATRLHLSETSKTQPPYTLLLLNVIGDGALWEIKLQERFPYILSVSIPLTILLITLEAATKVVHVGIRDK